MGVVGVAGFRWLLGLGGTAAAAAYDIVCCFFVFDDFGSRVWRARPFVMEVGVVLVSSVGCSGSGGKSSLLKSNMRLA